MGDRGILFFEDNDLAAEWCENRLYGEKAHVLDVRVSLAESPLFRGASDALISQVEETSQLRIFAAGERILEQGQEGDGRLFFIESGQVSILVPLGDRGHLRIASFGPGMSFGEMAFLGQKSRSAAVHAETEVHCRIVDVEEFNRISERHPLLKIAFLENLAKDLADRLRGANQWIAALA